MEGRWRIAQFAAAFLGLAISAYLTLYHYAGVPLVCSAHGLVDCASVLNSQYAYVFGLPLALYGVVFFIVEFAVLLRRNSDGIALWNMIGAGAVVYFVDIERMVGHICEWCTAVHIIVIFLLGISLYDVLRKPSDQSHVASAYYGDSLVP